MIGDQVEDEVRKAPPTVDDEAVCLKTERGWSERQVHWRRHREVLAPETITEKLSRPRLSGNQE